jgi:Reverse transcriptase (RNA-dependent DNA polymerase)
MAVFVDDILIAAPTNALCQSTFDSLAKHFKIQNRGSSATYLGVNISRPDRFHISINQSGYIDRMLKKYGMMHCAPERLPMNPSIKLYKSLPDDIRCDQQRVSQALWLLRPRIHSGRTE